MPILEDGYIDASCVIKSKNNDLLTMGKLHTIKESYIDISSTRNDLPEIPYNVPVKVEVYNSQIGFRVLIGNVYISSSKLVRIINLHEAAGSEKREFFRINIRETGYLYDKQAQEFEVELVDISLGGLMFKSERIFAESEEVTIRIPILETTNAFHCIVCRQISTDKGFVGYGCEFAELTSQQEDQLYKFMLKKQNDQLKRVH